MKIKLIVTAALTSFLLVISSISYSAPVPEVTLPTSSDSLKKQYLNYRYQMINCTGTMYLDMADVSMVRKDTTSITAWVLLGNTGFGNNIDGFHNVWWIFMKDGKVHYCGNPGINEAEIAFKNYISFLRKHPEFMTLK